MYRNGETHSTNKTCIEQSDDACFVSAPASAHINSILHHPQDEGKSEGYPTFKRQSSFHKQRNNATNSLTHDLRNSFEERLKSFQGKWPDWATIPSFDVAKAGMRYMGPEDKVQCEYCNGILYSWDDGDDPLKEHQKHFPQCSFIQERWCEILEKEIKQSDSYSQKNVLVRRNNKEANGCAEFGQMNQQGLLHQATENLTQPNSVTSQDSASAVQNLIVAKDIVKNLGYSDKMIQKAIKLLTKDISQAEINSSNMLDVLFSLEDCMEPVK